jgi:DNA-binding transcriptional LysR family regulator
MFTNNLNLNALRIFESVYRNGSMTLAARELHLTQSGISQHMKALEDAIGLQLFDRIKQRLVPTRAGKSLYERSKQALAGLEEAFGEIRVSAGELRGTILIGMPIEFGNNMVMPQLASFCQQHPQVKFNVRYGFATRMYELLLRGDLDYAFVDAFAQDRRITTEKVYDETLHLCATPALLKRLKLSHTKEDLMLFEKLEYVDYQSGEPILRMWSSHNLGEKFMRFNVRATVMDVQGVARLILSGLAAGVLPGHLVQKLEAEGQKLIKFRPRTTPLTNTISVAYLRERTQSATAMASLEWLKSRFKSEGYRRV